MVIATIWKDDPEKVVVDGDMGQATITSEFVPIRRYDLISFHVIWTGSPVGVFTVEASDNEEDASSFVALEMDVYPNTSIRTDNSENPFLIKIDVCPYRGIRLKYTRESGSGTLNVFAAAKKL